MLLIILGMTLLATLCAMFWVKQKSFILILFLLSMIFAKAQGLIHVFGMTILGSFWVGNALMTSQTFFSFFQRYLSKGFSEKNHLEKKIRWGIIGLLMTIALGIFFHKIPGFENPRIFDQIQFSSHSYPFTGYFNFNSTWLAILFWIYHAKDFSKKSISPSKKTWLRAFLGIGLILGTSLFIGYIQWDPKFPSKAWLWMMNNLFVCFKEEVFFRVFIQKSLEKLEFSAYSRVSWKPLLITSFIFGLAHMSGGLPLMALATLAGLFYAIIYQETRNLFYPIALHFLVNGIHFFGFSYPFYVA